MPAPALLMRVSASGKRKAGMALPVTPMTATAAQVRRGSFRRCGHTKSSITTAAMLMRKAPICIGVKTSSPRLIKIKELPQTRDKNKKISQARSGARCFISVVGTLFLFS
ncbi:MAG: hypothetical protein OHK0039_04030 [Bacteroidia bacterium]